jgi:integrase
VGKRGPQPVCEARGDGAVERGHERALHDRGAEDADVQTAGEIWQQAEHMPSLIFTGRYGTPIDPRTINRKFVARCEAAGVRPITVHDARHTCATLLLDLDVHPRVIMRILRHADQAVTMEIYANASSAATREVLRRLGDILH